VCHNLVLCIICAPAIMNFYVFFWWPAYCVSIVLLTIMFLYFGDIKWWWWSCYDCYWHTCWKETAVRCAPAVSHAIHRTQFTFTTIIERLYVLLLSYLFSIFLFYFWTLCVRARWAAPAKSIRTHVHSRLSFIDSPGLFLVRVVKRTPFSS